MSKLAMRQLCTHVNKRLACTGRSYLRLLLLLLLPLSIANRLHDHRNKKGTLGRRDSIPSEQRFASTTKADKTIPHQSIKTRPSIPGTTRQLAVSRECSTDLFSCCETSDCSNNSNNGIDLEQTCFNRHCIPTNATCLRFVLEWITEFPTTLDLFVRTPSGTEIWRANPEGDSWEEKDTKNYHIQTVSINNSDDGTCHGGIFQYFVIAPLESNNFNSTWTLSVIQQGDVVVTETGNGFGPFRTFSFSMSTQSQQPTMMPTGTVTPTANSTAGSTSNPTLSPTTLTPTSIPTLAPTMEPTQPNGTTTTTSAPTITNVTSPVPSITPTILMTIRSTDEKNETGSCQTGAEQCCSDTDCPDSNQVCANRNCVRQGFPRFTLTWIGSDDKDIIVKTPQGNFISFQQKFDPESGGRLEMDRAPTTDGYYAENIFFPLLNATTTKAVLPMIAPIGIYECSILSNYDDAEPWQLTIALNDIVVEEVSGSGDQQIEYDFELGATNEPIAPNSPPTLAPAPAPTPPPTTVCNTIFANVECCDDADCQNSGSRCANRNCVNEGVLRFTLTWVGSDDKDIRVITPNNVLIFFDNLVDPETEGRLEEDVTPTLPDHHAENIFFASEELTPFGLYRFGVSGKMSDERWELSVYAGGKLEETRSGVGSSADFQYIYFGGQDQVGLSGVFTGDDGDEPIFFNRNGASGSYTLHQSRGSMLYLGMMVVTLAHFIV